MQACRRSALACVGLTVGLSVGAACTYFYFCLYAAECVPISQQGLHVGWRKFPEQRTRNDNTAGPKTTALHTEINRAEKKHVEFSNDTNLGDWIVKHVYKSNHRGGGYLALEAEGMATVRKRAGLYECKTCHPEFADVLLVTIANWGFQDMLANWECHARRLGLDWVVLTLDDRLYESLGPERAVRSAFDLAVETDYWKGRSYNKLTCSKLALMVELMEKVALNMVFSDTDAVFAQDPFQMNGDLAIFMSGTSYDYVYQSNWESKPMTKYHVPVPESNTGFYYVACHKDPVKAMAMHQFFHYVAEHCGGNDQSAWWGLVNGIRQNKTKLPGFRCLRFCGNKSECTSVPESTVLNYCDLNPMQYSFGRYQGQFNRSQIYTYHANFVAGRQKKIKLLKNFGLWNAAWADGNCTLP